MKLLITIGLFLIGLTAIGQNEKLIEQNLLRQLKKIAFWRDSNKVSDVYDSLEKANDVFEQSLLRYTSHYPTTIGYTFKNLQKEGLTISISEDSLFKIYSWDTWTGGTMHFFENVFQYKAGEKVFSKVVKEPIYEQNKFSGNWYYQIFTVKASDKTYYLGCYDKTYSNKDSYQGVRAFAISNNLLNDSVKLIKTNTGIKNELGFDFDFFSVVDRSERPIKLITYDPKTQTFKIPVVTSDGKVTKKFIVYQLVRKYFVRVTK